MFDRALQQLRTEFKSKLRDPGVNLTYQNPFPDQQPTKSPVEFLKRFKVQHTKCRSLVSEEDVVRIAIKGLEPRQNVSSGTYVPGTLKPRYGPNRHRTVRAIYSHVNPYYPSSVAHRYSMDYDDENEVAALELVSKKPASSQSLRLARSPVKISAVAFTKP
ncbi:hypothetical protein ACLB2K_065533 [Fragaria x ananassa]